MKKRSLMLMIIAAILIPVSALSETSNTEDTEVKKADTKTQELDQVLAKYYKAIGGLEKWQKLNTMVMKGMMNTQGTAMPITAYHERPNKCRVEFRIEDMMMAQIFDGDLAWQINPLSGKPEPAPMTAGRSKYMRDTCGIENSLINYKEKGYDVNLLGKEKLDDRNYYKINIKYPSKNVETYYINAETFLIDKSIGIYKMDSKEIRTTTNFSEYRNTNGYVVPYKLIIEIHGAPGKETLKINKFIFNSKIDPKIYEFPKGKIQKMQPKKYP
jgi:hypothetical protein